MALLKEWQKIAYDESKDKGRLAHTQCGTQSG